MSKEEIGFPRMAYKKGTNIHRVVHSQEEYDVLLAGWKQTHEESGAPKKPDNAAHIAGTLAAAKAKKEDTNGASEKSAIAAFDDEDSEEKSSKKGKKAK